jgi:glucans biosynthesis protein C
VITLPVLLFLRSDRGRQWIGKLAGWAARPGGIFLFVIPLAIAQIALAWLPKTSDRTWADFFRYALYFVFGYILAADGRFTESIKRNGQLGLVLWVALSLGAGYVFTFVLKFDTVAKGGFSLGFVIWQVAYCLVGWGAMVFLLSLAAKYLNFTNPLLAYSNEAVLPFYLFHQTVILIVGWFVLPWEIGNWARFLIITAISLPLILILYEVFVRHIGIMRFLFGMTPRKKSL